MHTNQFWVALSVATVGIVAVPAIAEAVTFQSSNQSFYNSLDPIFQAEGQFGDNSPKPTSANSTTNSELLLRNQNRVIDRSNTRWSNSGVPAISTRRSAYFGLLYDGSTVTYGLLNKNPLTTNSLRFLSSTTGQVSGTATDIVIRTTAFDDASIAIQNLLFLGQGFNIGFNATGVGSTAGNQVTDTDFLRISDISQPFLLVGQVNLGWRKDGSLPTGNKLAYQIRVGKVIPTPALLPSLIGFGIAAWRKRQSRQICDA